MIPDTVEQLIALWASIDQELARRAAIQAGKARVREIALAILDAQAAGDPGLPALGEYLVELQRELMTEREKLWAMIDQPAPNRWSSSWPP